jgi:hypothetical protein
MRPKTAQGKPLCARATVARNLATLGKPPLALQ